MKKLESIKLLLNLSAYKAGILQGKSYRVMQNQLSETLLPYSLSIPEWKILGLLFDTKELKAVDLAAHLDVDPPLVTRLLNTLEEKKLVQKKNHITDKRVTLITITDKGGKLIPQIEKSVRKTMKELLTGVSIEEMGAYIKVLQTIIQQGQLLSIKGNYLLE